MKFSLCLSVAPTIKIYQETSTNKLLDKAMQIALYPLFTATSALQVIKDWFTKSHSVF